MLKPANAHRREQCDRHRQRRLQGEEHQWKPPEHESDAKPAGHPALADQAHRGHGPDEPAHAQRREEDANPRIPKAQPIDGQHHDQDVECPSDEGLGDEQRHQQADIALLGECRKARDNFLEELPAPAAPTDRGGTRNPNHRDGRGQRNGCRHPEHRCRTGQTKKDTGESGAV
jgi:hypothetical protein